MKSFENVQPYAWLLLRCGLALVFIYHGYPKLFGDRERMVEAFQAVGLPAFFVYLAGAIEFVGGIALALGFSTRIAALLLFFDMLGAMWKYNFNEGIYAVREYELPLVLGLACLLLVTTGGGPLSLDRLLSGHKDAASGANPG